MAERIQAQVKHVHMAPRKVRRILSPFRGMKAQQALYMLKEMPHAAAMPVAKLVRSAMANAEVKGLDTDSLYIVQLMADEGSGVMPGKGWRARWGGRGRYKPIRKRSSHITVVLEERFE